MMNQDNKGQDKPMYDLREKLRYRLTCLLVEANGQADTDKVHLLGKYEAIIFKELREFIEDYAGK